MADKPSMEIYKLIESNRMKTAVDQLVGTEDDL